MIKFFQNLLDINPANFSGGIDIIVVKQPDDSLKASPFHVRFGKFKIMKPEDKIINVFANGQDTGLRMKLGKAGEAYFVHETEEIWSTDETSPIMSPKFKPQLSP